MLISTFINLLKLIKVEKIKITIVSVFVYDQKDIASVELNIAEPIKGFAREIDANKVISFKETDVDSISINRSQLTRELCKCSDLIDEYRGCRSRAFDQKCLSLILRGAELTIVREAHATGEVVLDADGKEVKDKDGNTVVYKRDCYTTHIVAVKLTDRAIAKLDAACSLD